MAVFTAEGTGLFLEVTSSEMPLLAQPGPSQILCVPVNLSIPPVSFVPVSWG